MAPLVISEADSIRKNGVNAAGKLINAIVITKILTESFFSVTTPVESFQTISAMNTTTIVNWRSIHAV